MRVRAFPLLSTLGTTAGMTLVVTSCSLRLQPLHEHAVGAHQHAPLRNITQAGFGRDAAFAVCTEPACPAFTRKTLPATPHPVPQTSAPAFAPSIDTAATLDPGEVHLTVRHGAPDAIATPIEAPRTPVVVHFDSGSAALSAAARAALDQAASSARATDRILVAGRTDNVGSHRLNQTLALARARAVRDYLRTRLPARGPVFTLNAQGACCFSASNDTPQGRRHNRRVEIVFGVPEQVAP